MRERAGEGGREGEGEGQGTNQTIFPVVTYLAPPVPFSSLTSKALGYDPVLSFCGVNVMKIFCEV